MGLKEPVILNDVVGWRRRGGKSEDMASVTGDVLALLGRPFTPGEAVIVKPSNIVNILAPSILALRPDARAVLLHAPLRTYLASIAKKGLDGRRWARTLLIGLIDDGFKTFGYSARDLLGLTDLQVAAIGWLIQHALFARLVTPFGHQRLRTLDSESLIESPARSIALLSEHFGLTMNPARLEQILNGPAFSNHSKTGIRFTAPDRIQEHREAATTFTEEIEKVAIWTETVAQTFGIAMVLPAPLLATAKPIGAGLLPREGSERP